MSYDAERIVADYIRDETGLRVVATPPEDRDSNWVQLVELRAGQPSNSQNRWLLEHYFQLDCYAGKEGGVPEANAMAEAICEVLTALVGSRDGAVITACRVEGSRRDWDAAMEPARDRRVVTASVWMHP